jgi:hypothetical protein
MICSSTTITELSLLVDRLFPSFLYIFVICRVFLYLIFIVTVALLVDLFFCILLYTLVSGLNKLEINNKRVGILCDFQINSITPAYMKCLQNCLWMEEPLQYSKDILDQRLSILQFLSIDQRNIAFRLMRSSDRTKMMNDLHEDNDDKKSPKTKFLFIDGEMYDSPHLAKCLCNFFVHMHCWVENPTETMVYQQLHMRLMLFQSQGGKLWLEHTKMSHKHIFHSLMMDIQSVIYLRP